MFRLKIRKEITFFILSLMFIFFAISIPIYAKEINASNLQQLKDAIANGDSVVITNNIEVTEELKIPSDYKGEIQSNGKILTLSAGVENMFVISDSANVTFNDITFDGQDHGRIIDVGRANVTIKNSTIKKSTTEEFVQKFVDGKDEQRYEGGAIYAEHTNLNLENTIFEDNHTKRVVPRPGAPHGGAIVSYSANITIKGGKFNNNYTGRVDAEYGAHGEGGAIKLHPGSTLTINDSSVTKKDTTIFDGNYLYSTEGNGGSQGGAIEATQSKVHIYGTKFNIPGPFNTGGGIKFEECDEAVVTNSHFETMANKGNIGTAGGAITSQNTNLSIDSSSFKANKGSRVFEAGGLIQVTDTGTFNLTNSTLEGAGAWFNGGKDGLYTAKTGGAINFYDGSKVNATIKNTTIKNFMVDGAGAGISIANSAGHKANVDLTMHNTIIENTSAYVWQGTAHAGAIFVGEGNTAKIEGGKISSQTASNNAGGIFNEGSLTITGSDKGSAQITGNVAYQMVGGIYNDGYLKIDDATFIGNKRGDWSTGDGHILAKGEMGGINIYADKDIIITPNAKFDENDIRILDGQSKILLTGKLTKKINVSISEKAKQQNEPKNIFDRYSETQDRYIGYTVASGTDGYKATYEDARMLNYVSKDKSQPISEFNDYESIGKWDYVFNPELSTIVLGQRAKMTYHANYVEKSAHFQDKKTEKEQLYTFYGTGAGEPKVSINDVSVQYLNELDEKPVSKWIFDGWYNHKPKQPLIDTSSKEFCNTNEKNVSTYKVNFAGAYFIDTNDKIKEIINPNELHVYAGWKPLQITIEKQWDDDGAVDKAEKAVLSLKSTENNKPETFTATRENKIKVFDKLDKFLEDGITPIKYEVNETDIPDGYTNTVIQPDNSDPKTDKISAKITNTKKAKLYKVLHEFRAKDGLTVALPEIIKSWTPENQNDKADGTKVMPSAFDNKEYDDKVNGGKWSFVSWDKAEDTINGSDVKFVGTWNFTKTETPDPQNPKLYKVVHEFRAVDGLTVALPDVIRSWTPENQNDKADGTKVMPSAFDNKEYDDKVNGGKWSFVSWDKAEDTINGSDVKFVGTWNFTKTETPEPQTGSVYVKYISENGIILESESAVKKDAHVGEDYTTEQKHFDGYEFLKMQDGSAARDGKVIDGDLHVTYVYKKIETPSNPENPNNPNNTNSASNHKSPQTGDNGFAIYTIALVLSLGLTIVNYRKTKNNIKEK